MEFQLPRQRLIVAKYDHMTRADILGEDDCVELIEDQILEMAPAARQHVACAARRAIYSSTGTRRPARHSAIDRQQHQVIIGILYIPAGPPES